MGIMHALSVTKDRLTVGDPSASSVTVIPTKHPFRFALGSVYRALDYCRIYIGTEMHPPHSETDGPWLKKDKRSALALAG